eukprot:TRINITY_DN19649_c0_g1_i1.p1 TRINITY_DN19649_c0_g1~~TRINITY_DN19649_c0_g1_i1.p1  ORF type:complete len:332 (+),score=163.26 TRINITY_DN19649_c0_g1_i1:26-997(+)
MMMSLMASGVRSDDIEVLSQVIGWIYFLAWSISFYPQTILNYQRKSVVGLSPEYLMYNIQGFLFYAIYTIVNYIEQQRLDLNHSVKINDIAFAVHAVLLTSVQIYQCFIYDRGSQRINKWHALISIIMWAVAIYNVALGFGGFLPWYADHAGYDYNVVEYLGYVKAFISFIKYCPQAYMNYKRQSTVGWSIGNVLLDITGGTFSFTQQLLNAYNQRDWGVFTSDVPKLLLAVESVLFDLLFIFQHYVLYRHSNRDDPYAAAYLDSQQKFGDGGKAYTIADDDYGDAENGTLADLDDDGRPMLVEDRAYNSKHVQQQDERLSRF